MASPLYYVALAGLGSHVIFKHREPTVLSFCFLFIVIQVALFYYSFIKVGIFLLAAKYAALHSTCFVLGLVTSIVIYRLSPFHPLAAYPGPILAKISKWWIAYWIGKGTRHQVLQELHENYGPWVRIGPNELSVNLPAAIRPIYSQMFRAPFYQGAPSDADALITTTSRVVHDSRLIAWNKAFSTDALKKFRSIAESRTDQLVDILQRESKQDKAFDLSHWISLWAMDTMGDMSFSGGFETMAAGKDTEGWMDVLQMGVLFVGILGQVPWMRDLIALLPQPGPIVTFQQFASRKVLESRVQSDSIKEDILGILQDTSSGGPPLSEKEAAADASFMVVAGSDTVSQGSAALFRHIIGNVAVQKRLREEVKQAFEGQDIDASTLARLPYLESCVLEALRIVPPVAAGPPRYTETGNHILGEYIPPGTTVACPIYTLHHDPENFFEPEKYIPERWLSGRPEKIEPHNPEAFVPFCYGPGVCIGKPVALHNMKILVAKLLLAFEFEFADQFSLEKFDSSWKEHNLWLHDPLMVKAKVL